MSLTQTLITAVVAFLAAYRGALTRTSRLRGSIRTDLELLDALPPNHPSRSALMHHTRQLVDTLVQREARQFEPIIPAGASFGACLAFVVMTALATALLGLEAAGLYHPDPRPPQYTWAVMGFYASVMLFFSSLAFRAWRRSRQQREVRPPEPATAHRSNSPSAVN
jgi:hypothetical protein